MFDRHDNLINFPSNELPEKTSEQGSGSRDLSRKYVCNNMQISPGKMQTLQNASETISRGFSHNVLQIAATATL